MGATVCSIQKCNIGGGHEWTNNDCFIGNGCHTNIFKTPVGGVCNVCEFEQQIVVMRHGERLDVASPQTWFTSEEGKLYPFDGPITEKGRKQARDAAQAILNQGCKVNLVVCSPYQRCVQTAEEVANFLGVAIAVDVELGEIFGPRTMGNLTNPPTQRSPDEVMAFLENPDEVVTSDEGSFLGDAPEWPETLEDARVRFINRVEVYLQRSAKLRINFVLVTHGDCVAAASALLLRSCDSAIPGQVVGSVGYCGFVSASRQLPRGCAALANSRGFFSDEEPSYDTRGCCSSSSLVPSKSQQNIGICELANPEAQWSMVTHNLGLQMVDGSVDRGPLEPRSLDDELEDVEDVRAAFASDAGRRGPRRSTQALKDHFAGGEMIADLLGGASFETHFAELLPGWARTRPRVRTTEEVREIWEEDERRSQIFS